jgi:TetR/AcrR family transcriptional regulator, cholesterol catabolism regulator
MIEETDIKDKILNGTEELFMRYGVRSISMDDIARHLSVSKKTLYQHFADKDDLVENVTRQMLEQNFKECERIRNGAGNPIEELATISLWMKKSMEEINPTMLFDLQKFHTKAWNIWLEFKNKFIHEEVIRNLTTGIDLGFIRPVNKEIMGILRVEFVQMGFNQDIFPREKFNLAEVQSQIFDHFVFGLVTEKGRKLYLKYKEHNQQPSTIL